MLEVRRIDSGEEDAGDGFIFVWKGRSDDGSRGGVGFLLSPEAAKAWRKPGSVSNSSDTGRIIALSFALGGDEGNWHIISIYGPTSSCNVDEKDRFWSQLQDIYDSFPKAGAGRGEVRGQQDHRGMLDLSKLSDALRHPGESV